MYYTYIVSCSDESLYTGITTDLDRRVGEHNGEGKGAKYTKMRQPVVLQFSEQHPDRSSASKREHEIKKMTRIQKLKLIEE
ncbi:GIY-YIG nuclease family protein [Candidatus Gracilibacteria bacterium]|nr:GIY-YIG nuclease family protein [Candidatus Gracilibacteria bacterium]